MSDRVASLPLLTRSARQLHSSRSCRRSSFSGLAATDQHCGNGNCKVVVTAKAFGMTRDVVYDGGQQPMALVPLSVLPSERWVLTGACPQQSNSSFRWRSRATYLSHASPQPASVCGSAKPPLSSKGRYKMRAARSCYSNQYACRATPRG